MIIAFFQDLHEFPGRVNRQTELLSRSPMANAEHDPFMAGSDKFCREATPARRAVAQTRTIHTLPTEALSRQLLSQAGCRAGPEWRSSRIFLVLPGPDDTNARVL